MAVTAWREVHRTREKVALATTGATLIIEADRPAALDRDLDDVIARLAPHLAFGDAHVRGPFVERVAQSGDDQVTVGRYTRGLRSIAYLLATRAPIQIDDVIAEHLVDVSSPFDHLAD